MTLARRRLLLLVTAIVVAVLVLSSAPASGLSCAGLPERLLEGLAEDDPPDFWGHPDFATTAVVGRVAEQAPARDEFVDEGDWLGAIDVVYAIGRESVPARMDVSAGSGAGEWGVGMLPAEGDLIVIYHSRAVGDPVPDELFLDICPNSEVIDEDRAEAAFLLALDLGTLVVEPGDETTTTTTTTTEVPPTTEPPSTTTTDPPATTEPPVTTTTVDPLSGGSGGDDSSNGWLIWVGLGLAAAVVIGIAAFGPATRR